MNENLGDVSELRRFLFRGGLMREFLLRSTSLFFSSGLSMVVLGLSILVLV